MANPQHGYMRRLKQLWEEKYAVYNHLSEKHLRGQASFIHSKDEKNRSRGQASFIHSKTRRIDPPVGQQENLIRGNPRCK